MKLPPLPFYIEGLLKIMDHFPDRKIYCYLFTDALDPSAVALEFQNAIPPNLDLTLDWRKEGNHHGSNVLEDFFSLFNFDILVHPQSNFSLVAARIGSFAITYEPIDFLREDTKITITQTALNKNEILLRELLDRTVHK